MKNKTIQLFDDFISSILFYEQQSGSIERNDKGAGVAYNTLITLQVNDKMFESMRKDLKELSESVDVADIKYAGFCFKIKKWANDLARNIQS